MIKVTETGGLSILMMSTTIYLSSEIFSDISDLMNLDTPWIICIYWSLCKLSNHNCIFLSTLLRDGTFVAATKGVIVSDKAFSVDMIQVSSHGAGHDF